MPKITESDLQKMTQASMDRKSKNDSISDSKSAKKINEYIASPNWDKISKKGWIHRNSTTETVTTVKKCVLEKYKPDMPYFDDQLKYKFLLENEDSNKKILDEVNSGIFDEMRSFDLSLKDTHLDDFVKRIIFKRAQILANYKYQIPNANMLDFTRFLIYYFLGDIRFYDYKESTFVHSNVKIDLNKSLLIMPDPGYYPDPVDVVGCGIGKSFTMSLFSNSWELEGTKMRLFRGYNTSISENGLPVPISLVGDYQSEEIMELQKKIEQRVKNKSNIYLDDLGSEHKFKKDFFAQLLQNAINKRCFENGFKMHITTNLTYIDNSKRFPDAPSFANVYGNRVADRMMQYFNILYFPNNISYRRHENNQKILR